MLLKAHMEQLSDFLPDIAVSGYIYLKKNNVFLF